MERNENDLEQIEMLYLSSKKECDEFIRKTWKDRNGLLNLEDYTRCWFVSMFQKLTEE